MKKFIKSVNLIVAVVFVIAATMFVIHTEIGSNFHAVEYKYETTDKKDYSIIVPLSNTTVMDITSTPLKQGKPYVYVNNNNTYIPFDKITSDIDSAEVMKIYKKLPPVNPTEYKNSRRYYNNKPYYEYYDETITKNIILVRSYIRRFEKDEYMLCITPKKDNYLCFDNTGLYKDKPHLTTTAFWIP